jgi:hypothetical protein
MSFTETVAMQMKAGDRRRHPNDPSVVEQQLRASVLTLTPAERVSLLASIDRQLAEIDARKGVQQA